MLLVLLVLNTHFLQRFSKNDSTFGQILVGLLLISNQNLEKIHLFIGAGEYIIFALIVQIPFECSCYYNQFLDYSFSTQNEKFSLVSMKKKSIKMTSIYWQRFRVLPIMLVGPVFYKYRSPNHSVFCFLNFYLSYFLL